MFFSLHRDRHQRPDHPGPGDAGPHHRGRHGRHGHHDRHDMERGPHRSRENRVFDHGDLRLVILALLGEEPRYGYDIIKVLEDRVGGGYSPSPGVIYPTLTLLEEVGHASVVEERGRKRYTLTPDGQDYLAANRSTVDAILKRTFEGASARRGPPLPILRAFENLNTAMRLRFKGQTLSDAQIQAAAAAIDAAARAVEQI